MSQYPVIPADPHQEVMSQPAIFDDLKSLLASQLAASSIAMYQRDVKAYQKYADRAHLDPLDVSTFINWRDDLILYTTMSPNTINRMMSAVKRTLKEAASKPDTGIDESLFVRFNNVAGAKVKAQKKRLKQHSRTRISKEDMRRLCESPSADTLIGLRDRAMLAVLASSGIRASELASLTRGQIIQRDGGYILQVCGKTDIEYRDANVSREAIGLVEAWLAARPIESDYVFTSFTTRAARPTDRVISEAGVWLVVQKYADRCELPHVKPHDFRRYLGTQLAKTDIRKAQKALGHASIEVTARHYVLDELEVGQTDNIY